MRIPVVRGVIDRRILVNYRVVPDALARVLPAPFRPQLVNGFGIGGICLIRLKHVRPKAIPLPWGIGSENAAHRIAVEWEANGMTHQGVYIPRRDTNSRLNALAGGRVFPGEHHHARFVVAESQDRLQIDMESDDGGAALSVLGTVSDTFPVDSAFGSLADASAFFESGSVGYSATASPGRYDGLELMCRNCKVSPLAIEHVASSFFDDQLRFPRGTTEFDCALLMRGIEHEWHSRETLCCASAQSRSPFNRSS